MVKKIPNFGKQLVLAAFLFIFASTSYWLVYSQKPKEEAKKSDSKKLFSALTNEQVRSLEFSSQTLQVALDCLSLKEGLCKIENSSTWELVAPLKAKADDSTVNSLLKNLANLSFSEQIDLSTETPEKRHTLLTDFGLSPEQRKETRTQRLKITLEDGRNFTAYFGVKHPIADGVFALLDTGVPDEKRVLLVPDWQLSVFNQKTSYFRDKKLFSINDHDVSEFTISRSPKIPGKLHGLRDEATRKWALVLGNRKFAGDQDAIEGLLSGAVFLSAKDYLLEKKDSPEGRTVIASMTPIFDLELKTKAVTKRLQIFARKKAYYATLDDQDPIFEIDSFAFDKVDRPFVELRVAKLIGITDRYALTSLKISSTGKGAFRQEVVKESSGKWMIDGTESARGRVEGILDRLTSKIVKSFSGSAPSGDVLKIVFGKSTDEPVHQFEFWKNGARLFARDLTSAEHETVELMDDFSMQLPWDKRFLKDVNFGANPNDGKPHE